MGSRWVRMSAPWPRRSPPAAILSNPGPRGRLRRPGPRHLTLGQLDLTVPGIRAAELVLPQLATTLAGLLAQRADAARQI